MLFRRQCKQKEVKQSNQSPHQSNNTWDKEPNKQESKQHNDDYQYQATQTPNSTINKQILYLNSLQCNINKKLKLQKKYFFYFYLQAN